MWRSPAAQAAAASPAATMTARRLCQRRRRRGGQARRRSDVRRLPRRATASARPRKCPISPASAPPTSISSSGPINRVRAATARWAMPSSLSTTARWSRWPPTTRASSPRSRSASGAKPAPRQARPGPGGQGRRGGLRRMPRRHRHQQDARHAEPGRAGSEVSRRRDEGVQERPAQERHDEVDDGGGRPMPTWPTSRFTTRCKSRRGRRRRRPAIRPRAKAAAAACAGCHGDKGVSSNPANPSLAGQDAQYLAAALHAYKDGSRSDETMKGLAASLDEAAVKNLAAFYASQQPQPTNVRKPLTTAEWAQRCDRCHGVNGNSTDPRLPALAAQRVDYLEKVLHAYRTGERKSPQMAAMSEGLTRSGHRQSRGLLRAPEGACRRIRRAARQVIGRDRPSLVGRYVKCISSRSSSNETHAYDCRLLCGLFGVFGYRASGRRRAGGQGQGRRVRRLSWRERRRQEARIRAWRASPRAKSCRR